MDDVIKEFLIECHENLDLLDKDLVALESAPNSPQLLGEIFRTIHTIKGTSGFLALPKLEAVAHTAESLLSDLRDGKLSLSPEITNGMLRTVDAVRRILSNIEAGVEEAKEEGQPESTDPVMHEGNEDYTDLIASLSRLREHTPILETKAPIEAADPRAQGISDSTVRVDVKLLDHLMNLAGELVLARNQILQTTCTDPGFIAAAQRLNLISTDLQAGVMKARMQPIDNLLGKFPRMARDLAQSCGKQVRLEMYGRETELDRTIIETIKDPLTHLLRNAIDHGIEMPAERRACGKPEEGRVSLRAFHENGQVNIEIADDGAGLDVERIKAKAVERGTITPEAAARMSDREAVGLIFAPGFSTAAQVSNLSGRGVGMDVVKTNIEKIGGSVDIDNKPGHGMTLKVKIPLTLAIIPALIVKCGGQRYAIPQVTLIELVRLDEAKAIEHIHGAPVHRLRGELLPLVYLSSELQVEAHHNGAVDVVVLQAGSQRFGLVVDEVCDTEEIVVKPLGKQLKGTPCFAGATIMGDGSVALILDVFDLAQRSGLLGATHESETNTSVESADSTDDADGQQTLLLFDISDTQRIAIPLSAVARLEEFACADIERAGTREVMQYRGNILPLIRIASFFSTTGDKTSPAEGLLQGVIYNENGRSVGLIVDRIRDIVREKIEIQHTAEHSWTIGSAVVQNRVTDLLDVPAIIRAADSANTTEPNP